jgi:hypothetical protein
LEEEGFVDCGCFPRLMKVVDVRRIMLVAP